MDIHMYKEKKVFVTQLCPTLCDPADCSPPGSSVHGILQSRTLEWLAMPSSRISSWRKILDPSILPGGSTPGLLLCRQIPDHLSYREATKKYKVIPCYGDIYNHK